MVHHYIGISEKIIEPPFIILKPEVSEKDFFEFSTEDISCELIEGMLVIHSPASLEHENIFKLLLILLDLFLKKTNQGKVIGSRFIMRLGAKYLFEPDLMVLKPTSFSKLKATFLDGPPDFIIEILSPSTKETNLTKKIPVCLERGVKEIWAIDPMSRELTVFIPERSSKKYSGDIIVSSNILNNFSIKLKWIWNSEKYDPLECLNQILEMKTHKSF